MPLAIVDDGQGLSPATYYVHADHLNRPIAMTDTSKAFVARWTWEPFGGLFSYTGSNDIDLRFPGQLYQAESGLHYNWNRQYDPTIGRYTQPDPLGLVDGPSRYAYVTNDPLQMVDSEGLVSLTLGDVVIGGAIIGGYYGAKAIVDTGIYLGTCIANSGIFASEEAHGESCDKQLEHDEKQCFKNYSYDQVDLRSCLQRASIIYSQCLRGQDEMSPWSDGDSDGWVSPKPSGRR